MGKNIDIRIRRLLSVALLALLLGAQSAQAGHFHADYLLADDCLQCVVDYGQTLKPSTSPSSVATKPGVALVSAASPAAFSTHYRRSARGPPPHSC